MNSTDSEEISNGQNGQVPAESKDCGGAVPAVAEKKITLRKEAISREFEGRLTGVEQVPCVDRHDNGKLRAVCPAHADKEKSLIFFRMGGGDISFRCLDGCTFEKIIKAVEFPELADFRKENVSIFCNSDKASKALQSIGFHAENPRRGLPDFPDSCNERYSGHHVVVISDNDKANVVAAKQVAKGLSAGPPASIKIIELPDIPPGGGPAEWIAAGGTAEKLREIIAAAPVFGSDDLSSELLGDIMSNYEMISQATQPKFLFRNFLTEGSLIVCSGPEKCWKTTIGVHIQYAAAGHGKFLDEYENLQNVPSVALSGESSRYQLKSMQHRILEWVYKANPSMLPDPKSIKIWWGNDPPDLGDPDAIPKLRKLINDTGSRLMILDPVQAMFTGISQEMPNDAAMLPYLKMLQKLARETGCAIMVMNHNRQHVPAGIPKRSDSSFGAFMKFCDAWVQVNHREEPDVDSDGAEGNLWIKWGGRDGFGGLHAIDIKEGTVETGRFFYLKIIDKDHAVSALAGRKADRKGQESKAIRQATIDRRKQEIDMVLTGLDVGFSIKELAARGDSSRNTIAPVVEAMLAAGELVSVPAEYTHNKSQKIRWADGVCLAIGRRQDHPYCGGKRLAENQCCQPCQRCQIDIADISGCGGAVQWCQRPYIHMGIDTPETGHSRSS